MKLPPAQEKLAEIAAMRDSLADALRARDNTGIEQARETIHAASIEVRDGDTECEKDHFGE